MAQPAYIIPANFFSNAAVDDVQDILDDLDVLLAANGWTVAAPGGPYTAPADPAGRFFTLTFTRINQTTLDCAMTDDHARTTSTREMQITGTQNVDYYYGTRYLYIVNTGQEDTIFASLLSLYPESETVHDRYCIFFGTRNSGGARDNYLVGSVESVRADTGAYVAQGVTTTGSYLSFGSGASTYCTGARHLSGARRWFPAWQVGQDAVTPTYRLRGRLYNTLLMSDYSCSKGSEYTVPLDQATTGVFKIINVSVNTTYYYFQGVRKS